MASVATLIGGALVIVLGFTGSSYLFSGLSKGSIDKERKWHDFAIKQLQKAQVEWTEATRVNRLYYSGDLRQSSSNASSIFVFEFLDIPQRVTKPSFKDILLGV